MRFRLATAILAMLFASANLIGADDLFIGTWEFSVAKSRSRSGQSPRSATVKIEPAGQGVKVTIDTVSARGTTSRINYTANFDGRRNPHTDTAPLSPPGLEVAVARIDERVLERTTYLGDKRLTTVKWVVSEDGQLLTATETGRDARGEMLNRVSVYERQ